MKKRKDHEAAAKEAFEEAGVSGRVHKHPMGAYTYLKGRTEQIRVMVYMLEVHDELEDWPEKHERERRWVSTHEAARRVEEPGLAEIIKRLDVAAYEA